MQYEKGVGKRQAIKVDLDALWVTRVSPGEFNKWVVRLEEMVWE